MDGPERLRQSEDHWITDMGAFLPAEGRVVFRGEDLHRDCKDMPWMGLLLYGITGRRFGADQIKLFEGLWTVGTSYPDPRIWNNRVAALAGTAHSTAALAIAGANAVSEATLYGHRPFLGAIDLLLSAKAALDGGGDIEEFINTRRAGGDRILFGYGRPIRNTDERIKPMLALLGDLGFPIGPHVAIAFQIEAILLRDKAISMNAAALLAAICADQGLSRREFHHFMILSFSAGMFPCYAEAANRPGNTFFPLRCDRIGFFGKSNRTWE
ncbi:hypothetical protein SAMN02949497_2912 [Methylomagnum ishizawai]|uniref:Uncharacterized protein n=1 Tax=Methylomagnum ishizawai TaxID=1760988 RepID=A0A1Y6CYU4_9GAMM|nr:hypothetical protein [Methylomagnum ishizawai]SMF95547.1 hypothetical protein SAMN02949497_2912 [Methylomagnum ishizawai]